LLVVGALAWMPRSPKISAIFADGVDRFPAAASRSSTVSRGGASG
jgi:hypothetical protein